MKNNVMLSLIVLFLSGSASAAEDVLHSQEYKLKGRNGSVHVVVRKTSVVLGMPYSIELRPNCSGTPKSNFKSFTAEDSRTVCDVKAKSLRLRGDGDSISIMVREVDEDLYNEQTMKLEADKVGDVVPACKKATSELVLSLRELCR